MLPQLLLFTHLLQKKVRILRTSNGIISRTYRWRTKRQLFFNVLTEPVWKIKLFRLDHRARRRLGGLPVIFLIICTARMYHNWFEIHDKQIIRSNFGPKNYNNTIDCILSTLAKLIKLLFSLPFRIFIITYFFSFYRIISWLFCSFFLFRFHLIPKGKKNFNCFKSVLIPVIFWN